MNIFIIQTFVHVLMGIQNFDPLGRRLVFDQNCVKSKAIHLSLPNPIMKITWVEAKIYSAMSQPTLHRMEYLFSRKIVSYVL